MITLIAALAHNNVIGTKNDLPWYLPADLRHFKDLTTGSVVIMGRNTFDSIYSRLKRPLPNRTNIVITRDRDYMPDGVRVFYDIETALVAFPDAYIIGGASIYEQTIHRADKLELTEVHADILGDTYFPDIDPDVWRESAREEHSADDTNPYDYSFVTYERV